MESLREKLEASVDSRPEHAADARFNRIEGARLALESLPCRCNEWRYTSVGGRNVQARQCDRCQALASLDGKVSR